MLLKRVDLRSFEEVRNGVPLRFKIQTITPDLIEDVLQHMFTQFLTRKPIIITTVYEGKVFNKLLKGVKNLTEIGNVFKTYDLERYLTSHGLSVHSDYHGYNIGLRLLETRELLCQELGLKATATVFSNKVAQYLAAKDGYKTLAEQSFQTMEIDGQIAYPGVDGSLKLMGIKYV
ncbi:uncharacterized protein [Rhodnius prolixus]|uniref:uncharacterized protein n=1 Tax=Rhodnius prolixus TaxID=13249 RepID=UPI003D1892BC